MTDQKNPVRDQGQRIIRFRQYAFLLENIYTQVEIAEMLGVKKENFHKYYLDPDTSPGIKFLNKFDEVFGGKIKILIDYLKTYNKGDLSLVEEQPREEYLRSGPLNDYIESLKDHIRTLKDDREISRIDREADRGQIAFLQHLINRHLQNNVPEKTERQVSGDFNVKIVEPENEPGESDKNERE